MRNCLITGASGLIGTHLVPLLAESWTVHALSRSAPTTPGVRHVPIDLGAGWAASALPSRLDAVVHLAQSENFRNFPEQAEDIFNVNTQSTLRLLDHARRAGARTFVLASTGGVYAPGDAPCSEDADVVARGDLGFYAATKLSAELLAEGFAPHMNVVVLRYFFVYGPGQRQGMLVPRLIQSVRQDQPVTLQGTDGLKMNPIFAADAAQATARAMELEGSHRINVAGPETLSLRAMAEAIGRVAGKAPRFEVQPDVAPRHLIAATDEMKRLLLEPGVRFEAGVRRMLES